MRRLDQEDIRGPDIQKPKRLSHFHPSCKYTVAFIGGIIEEWVLNEGCVSKVAKSHNIADGTISRWVTKYYMPAKKNHNTKVITLQSKV